MKPALLPLLLLAAPALAHHGVASLGAAGLEGPGAAVETSGAGALPEGKILTLLKVDHAKFKTFNPAAAEVDYNQYWMAGLGFGLRPWFSLYAFQPYNIKMDEPGGLNSRGPADLSLTGSLGFKYDDGWRLLPAQESLDDQMDWHFALNAGLSLPTGNANHRLVDGSIDPGKSLGFGKASFNYSLSATRQFSDNDTLVMELGQIRFQRHAYEDGQTMRFGAETRLNLAWTRRLMTLPDARFRLDSDVELNYLNLGRDVVNGAPDPDTGGDILYGVLGLRLYQDTLSLGLALKKPIQTRLNALPGTVLQGAEGREQYRLIATFSAMF